MDDFGGDNHSQAPAWTEEFEAGQDERHPRINMLGELTVKLIKDCFGTDLEMRGKILISDERRIADNSIKAPVTGVNLP